MSVVYIYTLEHPETGEIRYVGKTINPKRRLSEHMVPKSACHSSKWAQKLRREELMPIMQILEETDAGNWEAAEIYWIAQMKAWGFRLTNSESGGHGKERRSKESRELISKIHKGRDMSYLYKAYAQYSLQGDYIQTFPSTTMAAKALNGFPTEISFSSKTGTACRGFLWKKDDGNLPLKIATPFNKHGIRISTPEQKAVANEKRMATLEKKGVSKSRPSVKKGKKYAPIGKIHQLTKDGELVKIWEGAKQAASELGMNWASIYQCMAGRLKTSGGFVWQRQTMPLGS